MLKNLAAIFLLVISLQLVGSAQLEEYPPYRITRIQAFLYYNQDNSLKRQHVAGTYSPNLIDNPEFSLWNTIIGAGDAAGNSDQTLVVVEIQGSPKDYVRRQLHFKALAGGKIILDRKIFFAILDNTDKYFAAFMLYGTGCQEIKLVATISGKMEESRLEKSIVFECGE